jgi:hypothetical protein
LQLVSECAADEIGIERSGKHSRKERRRRRSSAFERVFGIDGE